MCLEFKKQKAIYESKLLSLNGNKQCIRDVFREWDNSSMLRLI